MQRGKDSTGIAQRGEMQQWKDACFQEPENHVSITITFELVPIVLALT